ncbi:MAG: deoxyhypusine synthase family protein [Candidatus Pacearchaeota archaeon]|nr:deoxyhypusine synthase family protein [Candidatus Pacearchaeota archaeon]
MEKIEHIKVKKDMKVSELVEEMEKAGFGAEKIGKASSIMKKMFDDKECTVFFGVAGAMVPAGMKQIILDILDYSKVFVTTGANLTHDLIESLGESHYQGDDAVDDTDLNKQGIDRIYNVFMKNSVYEKLEEFFEKNFEELKKCGNIREFLWKLGELSPGDGILKKCYEKRIPIFCPGIADSGIGLMMWSATTVKRTLQPPTDSSAMHPNQERLVNSKEKNQANIMVFDDMKEIIDIAWISKKSGVIYIGGGLPKNFIQQSLQFSKGADYGIQITTDRTEPGGSSGAPLREGISWGKMKKDAEFVDVFCDATIALPIILASIKE